LSITGTNANDTLIGTSANDTINGGNGNDTIFGGAGADTLSGDNGNDVLDGGSGSDLVFGGVGDDTAIYVAVDNLTAHDVYDGGIGNDTLVLKLTQTQFKEMNASTVFADFRAAVGSSTAFDFSSYHFSFNVNLSAKGFEHIQTSLIADPTPPAAHADVNAITEDAASSTIAGNVLANDTVGGIVDATLAVTNPGVLSGHYGTLTLNVDGSYSYLLDQTNAALNTLNDGDTLQESFAYTITDGYSRATSQLNITINGHTDPPPAAHPDTNAITEDDASSTIAGNVLANDSLGGILNATLQVINPGVLSGFYGSLTLNADGSYGYLLDQTNAALNTLNDGDTLQESFAYTITDGYGRATSQLTITINGHTDPAPLFTAGDDAVDFNAVVAGSYHAGTQYDALGGNDTIILPSNTAEAAEAGFAVGTVFHTGDGNNTVIGGSLDDIVIGGSGSDRIDGGAGNDTLSGAAGNDVFISGGGNDLIDGGTGIDQYVLTTATTVSLWDGIAFKSDGGVDHLSSIEQVYGSAFNDFILGDNGDNTLAGAGGDDTIYAEGGNDLVIGGTGNDYLDGGAGINRVSYEGSETGLYILLDQDGGFARKGDVFNLPFDAPFDYLRNFQEAVGSNFTDVIFGDTHDNSLFGNGGDDFLFGGAGNDRFDGGPGRDHIEGGDGDDLFISDAIDNSIFGGEGFDTIDYSGVRFEMYIHFGLGFAGEAPLRTIYPIDYPFLPDGFSGIESVIGGQGNDTIIGDQGDNRITGYLGNDTLAGLGGHDVFHFDLSGDANVGNDRIMDFEIGIDRISLSGGLHADLGDLNPQQVGADTVLDLGPGMKLTLQHIIASQLTNSDFIFA